MYSKTVSEDLTDFSMEDKPKQQLRVTNVAKNRRCTLMVAGSTIPGILEDPAASIKFASLVGDCESVIVYRCSPSQKA